MSAPVVDLNSVFDFMDESSEIQLQGVDPFAGQLVASPIDEEFDEMPQQLQPTQTTPQQTGVAPTDPPGAPRRVRSFSLGRTVAADRKHTCDLHATHDLASRKANRVWADKDRRMNVLTHATTVPCDMLSLTRQRIQFEALTAGVKKTEMQLIKLVAAEKAHSKSILSLPYAGTERVFDVNDETHNNKLAGHDSLDKFMALMGESKQWQALRADASSGKLQLHMSSVRKAILQFREASESIAYVFERARTLRQTEDALVQLMYPQTIEDVHRLLTVYDIVREDTQPSIVLPTLDGDVCQICQEAEVGQTFLRVVPHCSTHAGCIEERRNKRSCQCVGKMFHVNCLATDILYHYRGDTNDGVGRSLLRCPTCRNSYCITDLVAVRVLEASPQKKRPLVVVAAEGESTPTKKVRTYAKRDQLLQMNES